MTEFFGERQAAAVLKHAILEKYLPGFVGKAGSMSHERRVAYVDGFAGPGLYDDGSEGSPAVAVDTARTISTYTKARSIDGHLVEKSRESCDALRQYIAGEGLDWQVYEGHVEEHLLDILGKLHPQEAAFFFLDPFGLGVPFEMLGEIMKRGGAVHGGMRMSGAPTEILLNFSLPGLRRNAGHLTSTKTNPKYLKSRETILARVDRSMGGNWWRDIWTTEPADRRSQLIHREYTNRLLKLVRGSAYTWSIPCADKWQGAPSYVLIFLTQHPDGSWLFHQACSTAMEVYREFCHAKENRQPDLFDDPNVRKRMWIDEIKANIERLLREGPFVVREKMRDVYGNTLTFARETHVRSAIKELHKEEKTPTTGVGDIPPMRVVPPT